MFDQILDLVGQPPGSLVYHFIVLFAVEAAFAISIGQWMRERSPGTLRLAIATFAIFCGRVAMLIAALAAWQGYLPHNLLLPPVERMVDTVSALGLAWAFVTMDDPEILRRNFLPDVTAAVTLGVASIGFVGTYYYWSSGAAGGLLFNGLWLDAAWSIAQIALAAMWLVWMLTRVRYVYDPFLKGIMLFLVVAGAAIHLVRPVLGDVAAAMRVSQIVVLPMLAAVAYRHVIEQLLHWDTFEPSRLTESPPLSAPAVEQEEASAAGEALPAPLPGMADETARREAPLPAPAADYAAAGRGGAGIAGRRIAYCHDFDGLLPLDPEVGALCRAAVRRFGALGCTVEEACFDASDLMTIVAGTRGFGMVGRYAHRVDAARGRMTPHLLGQIDGALKLDLRTVTEAERLRTAYWHRVRALLERFDYIATPAIGLPAFRLDEPVPTMVAGRAVAQYDVYRFTYAFSVVGLPVAAVPCGFTRAGLPVGLQIAARRLHDEAALEIAAAYMAAHPEAVVRPSTLLRNEAP